VLIDQEVKSICLSAYERARSVVEQHRDALVRVAEALLEYEVLDGDEVAALVKGEDASVLAARKRRKPRPEVAPQTPRPAAEAVGERRGPAIAPDPIKQPS